MSGGERHKRDRKLLTPPFNGSRMRAYGRTIVDVTREETRAWDAGWQGGVHGTTTAISLDVIVRAVFGIDQAGRREQAGSIVKRDVDSMVPAIMFVPALRRALFGLGPWSRFARARRELDALLYGEIASRRASTSSGEDILSLILDARYDDGSAMTDDEVRDQLITLLAAGHETTATALAWALYWTASRPPIVRGAAPRLSRRSPLGPGPGAGWAIARPSRSSGTRSLRGDLLRLLHPIVPGRRAAAPESPWRSNSLHAPPRDRHRRDDRR